METVSVLLLVLFLVVLCGGGGLLVLAMLIVGVVLLRRSGDAVTVRRAVTVGADSVSQVFLRRPGGLVPTGPGSTRPISAEPVDVEVVDEVEQAEVIVEHTTAVVDNAAHIPVDGDDDEAEEAPTEAKTSFTPRLRKLRRVGFFADLPHGDAEGASVAESRNEAAQPHEVRIVAYLRQAPVLIEASESVADVLDPAGEWIGPPSIHTDGVWAWPADLAHYVEHYHVTLPTPFVEHLVDRGYAVADVDLEAVELGAPSAQEDP